MYENNHDHEKLIMFYVGNLIAYLLLTIIVIYHHYVDWKIVGMGSFLL